MEIYLRRPRQSWVQLGGATMQRFPKNAPWGMRRGGIIIESTFEVGRRFPDHVFDAVEDKAGPASSNPGCGRA